MPRAVGGAGWDGWRGSPAYPGEEDHARGEETGPAATSQLRPAPGFSVASFALKPPPGAIWTVLVNHHRGVSQLTDGN